MSRSYTPSKGKATPKRTVAQRQRRATKPPSDPKERRAWQKQQKEKDRVTRQEAYAGYKAGDERYLPARDKGPERALVRDIIDSRRTAGTLFFGGAFILLFLNMVPDARAILAANLIFYMLALAVFVDTFLICRKVKRMVKERFPQTGQRMGSLYFYAFSRSIMFRRLRMPRPKVNLGDKI